MTKRESKYFTENKKCRKEYVGNLVRTNPIPFHGFLMDIPLIFEAMSPNIPHEGIITKVRRTATTTKFTISPKLTS